MALYGKNPSRMFEPSSGGIGMQVPELPEYGVKTIETDDGIRFVYDGAIYKAVPTKKGVKYEVVGFMK